MLLYFFCSVSGFGAASPNIIDLSFFAIDVFIFDISVAFHTKASAAEATAESTRERKVTRRIACGTEGRCHKPMAAIHPRLPARILSVHSVALLPCGLNRAPK